MIWDYWPVSREVKEWRWSDEQIQITIGVAVAMPRLSIRQSIKWPATAGTWTRQQHHQDVLLFWLGLFKCSDSISQILLSRYILEYICCQRPTYQSSQLKFISLRYLKQAPSLRLVVHVLPGCKSLLFCPIKGSFQETFKSNHVYCMESGMQYISWFWHKYNTLMASPFCSEKTSYAN